MSLLLRKVNVGTIILTEDQSLFDGFKFAESASAVFTLGFAKRLKSCFSAPLCQLCFGAQEADMSFCVSFYFLD